MFQNPEYLQLQDGSHPKQPNDPTERHVAINVYREQR